MRKTNREFLLEQLAIGIDDFTSNELDELLEYILALKAGTLDNQERDKLPYLADFNNLKKKISNK